MLVLFKTQYCPYCKKMTPVLEELASEHGEELRAFYVDLGENPELGSRYQVLAVPTTLLFFSGDLKETFGGVTSKDKLWEAVSSG